MMDGHANGQSLRSTGSGITLLGPARPVFLHTGWRSAGTWIWSCFRELRKARTYYEPFHAALAWKEEPLAKIRTGSWESGHPAMAVPYFSEFLPMVRPEGGVEGFQPCFELDRFDLDPETEAPELAAYLQSLIQAAKMEGRAAVFKFCRSMGRMPWMIKHFPEACHIAVLRNPASQWSSYWKQYWNQKNPWFIAAPYRVLGGNLSVPKVQRAICALRCDEGSLAALASQTEAEANESVKALSPALSYRTHLAHWVLSQMSISKDLDGLLDSDLLALSGAYGAHASAHFAERSGLRPDFSSTEPLQAAEVATPGQDWMGVDRREAIDANLAAAAFAESELGEGNRLALSVVQSKLGLANQKLWLGGPSFLVPPGGIGAHGEWCSDPLSLQALLQLDRPVPPKLTRMESVVETTMGLAGRGARAFRLKRNL